MTKKNHITSKVPPPSAPLSFDGESFYRTLRFHLLKSNVAAVPVDNEPWKADDTVDEYWGADETEYWAEKEAEQKAFAKANKPAAAKTVSRKVHRLAAEVMEWKQPKKHHPPFEMTFACRLPD